MSKRPSNLTIRDAKQALTENILTLSGKIPPGHNEWSYQRSVGFKEAIASTASYATRKTRTMPELTRHYSAIKEFWA